MGIVLRNAVDLVDNHHIHGILYFRVICYSVAVTHKPHSVGRSSIAFSKESFFSWHSQTVNTLHPSARSRAKTSLSRSTLRVIFSPSNLCWTEEAGTVRSHVYAKTIHE